MKKKIKIPAHYVFIILIVAGVYSFGLGGLFFIDDAPSLDGLLNESMSEYIFGGTTGPLGRPVALLSFWLQRDSYPELPFNFLLGNVFIHTLNTALLLWAVHRLQERIPDILGTSPWLAPSVAMLWGAMPILASASLMIVQRMTTLSATFVLLGLHAYIWASFNNERSSAWRSFLGAGLIGCCTLLAAFTKENGVLLPLLLLVVHYTLNPVSSRKKNVILTILLWLPSIILLGYIATRIPGVSDTYWRRPFSLTERLASQAVILWEYVRIAFLPAWADMSPYRDDYPIRNFYQIGVQLAIVCWVLVLGLAVFLWRTKKPLLLFALCWFLLGHLLESSIFSLFLYFEHRNYIPLAGPVIALAVMFFSLPIRPQLQNAIVALYGLFMVFTLWQVVDTWGKSHLLLWAKQHPDSPRAIQMIAGSYMQAGKLDETLELYASSIKRNPQFTSVALQGLRASCYKGKPNTEEWLTITRSSVPSGDYSYLSIPSLQASINLHIQKHCEGIATEDFLELVRLLKSNSLYTVRQDQEALLVLENQLVHYKNK